MTAPRLVPDPPDPNQMEGLRIQQIEFGYQQISISSDQDLNKDFSTIQRLVNECVSDMGLVYRAFHAVTPN